MVGIDFEDPDIDRLVAALVAYTGEIILLFMVGYYGGVLWKSKR